ncbi:MAG TPA: hypothetical protein VFV51_12895 [Vicinamibacterales bacterium]|nr:hypothetical protein [Vicinamibacterales bacterium]
MNVTMRVAAIPVAVVIGVVLAPLTVLAQESRAALIESAQAAKARALTPYEPHKAEQIAADLKKRLLDSPQGLYPWFDSVYSGGGFTGGAGYRRFVGDAAFVDVRGLLSGKGYKLIEVAADSLGQNRRLQVRGVGGWRDATQVAFYGIGSGTSVDDVTNFQMQQTYAGVSGRVRGPARLFGEASARYEDYVLLEGNGSSPSIEQVHTPASAPGLGASPTYLRSTIAGGVDWRSPAPGYARSGGLYAITYDAAADLDDGEYSFEILQGEVVQHVPILRENWVLSFHGVARTTVDDDDTVPYFLMPSLGSGSTLRAFPSWRFRDRHSLLMSGEFRWIPSRLLLDVAIFYDTGKVAARREDLDFNEHEHNWGLGARFHGPLATPLRIEVARGREGFNLVFSGAAAF